MEQQSILGLISDSLAWRPSRRVPVITQNEAGECGLACLAMIANHHGHAVDLVSLRQRFRMSGKGLTLADLTRIADAMQFAARALRIEIDDLDGVSLPCVLHWEFNHFVVLTSLGRDKVTINDPALGVRELSRAELSRCFTGVALELRPVAGFRPIADRRRIRLRELLGEAAGLRRAAAQILLLALALEVFAIIAPFFLQWVIDGVIPTDDKPLLVMLGVGFGLLVIAAQAIAAARSWVVLYVSTMLNFQWLTNVFTHLLRLPATYFEKRQLGDVYSRFQATTAIQRTLTTSFVEAVLDGFMALITLAMMLIYSIRLTAIAVLAVGLYGLLRWAWYRPLRLATEEQIASAARQNSHFFETVRGVRSIQLFSRENERRATWLNLLAEQVNAEVRTQRLTLAYRAGNGLLLGLERIAIIWLAALLVLDREFSVGMLFAFIAYKDQFATRVSGLVDKAVELKMVQLQGERLADIVLTPTESDGEPGSDASRDVEPSLELTSVAFRYSDGEPWVLDGVSLSVRAGECVAIVGPSGCGKTTLMKVMVGLLTPEEGEVRVGGVPARRLGIERFRSLIGTVLQDDQLFAGTLLQNICFFDPTPDLDHVRECAQIASIHDEILAMPMGYNTLIGDMGSSISGGQQQRVLLARALYKRPAILLLDESTSHLDVAREKSVNGAVQRLDLTRIVIAHRPDTIAMADRVIRLERGKVAGELKKVGATTSVPTDPEPREACRTSGCKDPPASRRPSC